MPRKKQLKKSDAKKPEAVSMLYDDALPVSLLSKGIAKNGQAGVIVNKSQGIPVSPYIIELSKETDTKTLAETEQTGIEKLSDLLLQASDLAEVDEIDSATPTELNLEVTLEELSEQLREPEKVLSEVALNEKTSSVAIDEHVPVAIPSILEIIDETSTVVLGSEDCEQIVEEIQIETPEVTIEQTSSSFSSKLGSFGKSFANMSFILPKAARHRAMAAFLILSFILVMPLHAMQGLVDSTGVEAEISRISSKAMSELERAADSAQSQEFGAASLDFERATESFEEAEESLKSMHLAATALVNIIPQTDNTYDTVQGLVQAGASLSKSAALLSTAVENLSEAQSYDLVTKLELLTTYIDSALPEISKANIALEQVDLSLIPTDYEDKIELLLNTAPSLETAMNEFLQYSQTLQTLLGGDQKMRYLLAFQNNTELRATGGFVGSFAQIDMLHGEIDEIEIPEGGTYDVQGQLSDYIAPPEPLTLLNSRWELQDANWFPDFPSSAQKMLDFYQSAGGPTLDGVIAINATLMPQLLAITGPIEMPEYNRTINAENFMFETQKIVEIEYDQYQTGSEREEDAPKQFIGDLAPKILDRLGESEPEELLQILDLLVDSLWQKDVILFMSENELQSDIEALGWSGSLKQTDGDYLMVVNTNLGGGKTDSVIKQEVEVDVHIQNDGSIINSVTITKTHTGMSSAIFEGNNNVDYIRLYTPLGSELLSAEGFEIPSDDLFKESEVALQADEDMLLWTSDFAKDMNSGTDIWSEQGKTVFGNWIQTKPGETETIKFTYKLPFTFEQSENTLVETAKAYMGIRQLNGYSLLLQKQPGVETRTSIVNVFTPDNQTVVWSSQPELVSTGAVSENEHDNFFSVLFEQK